MSLANKYRPQTFDEMVGQEHIIDILKAQMSSRDTVHHNYLLFGPRGTGKTTSARLIAKGLNCLNLQNGNPCNQCPNCETINNGTSLDYVEIDAASHTGVDNIREEIIDKAYYPPTALQKKIYVIDEVHMLSKGAFNALLKTIEEPKNNVCFILATTEIHKVPETIISRCQVFNYKNVPNTTMLTHLEKICKQENLQYSLTALGIIANISEGCVRDAVKYVDQVSILGELSEENVSKFLGVAGEATIKQFLNSIKSGNRDEIFHQVDLINQHGIDLSQFSKQVIGYIDQHLLEDTDFFLNCSEIFSNILSIIRWYPYPAVAYKIAINKYLNPLHDSSDKKEVQEVKNSQKNDNNTAIPQEDPVHPVEMNKIPEEQSQSHSEEANLGDQPQIPNNGDFSELWKNVMSKINKPTIQSNLKDQAIIEEKSGNEVTIIVITKIAEMLLSNPENKKLIEELLAKEFHEPITLKIVFEKKEDYFARKMAL